MRLLDAQTRLESYCKHLKLNDFKFLFSKKSKDPLQPLDIVAFALPWHKVDMDLFGHKSKP